MEPGLRIVTKIPLTELWSDAGRLVATRVRSVGHEDIAEMLRNGLVRFVVVDCGHRLQWVDESKRFQFWKLEVAPHLIEPAVHANGAALARFPDEFFYSASEWRDDGVSPIVVLEKSH